MKKKTLGIIIVSVLGAAAIFCSAMFTHQYLDAKNSKAAFDDLTNLITEIDEPQKDTEAEEADLSAEELAAAEAALAHEKYEALFEQNNDFIGWIKIDDTDVDLPVMQREGDNSYYLKHDLDGNWDDLGLPYLDYECDIQQSRHLILYGHNMGVGDTVRFSSLQNYREPEYYQEHPVIELDNLNGGQYYKIVAVYAITTRESDGDVFHFNQYVNFADDAAEQEYLDEVAKRAFYTTGDYARADERLLTLCTCTYEMSDARLLIMARPLRDGETLTADEVIINPDPLLPARWPAGA